MAHHTDWYPRGRTAQITFCQNWITNLAAKAAAWKIPPDDVKNLTALAREAGEALAEAQNELTRTPVATAKCKQAFKNLEDAARDLKKRYLYVPPLADACPAKAACRQSAFPGYAGKNTPTGEGKKTLRVFFPSPRPKPPQAAPPTTARAATRQGAGVCKVGGPKNSGLTRCFGPPTL